MVDENDNGDEQESVLVSLTHEMTPVSRVSF